jgi:hypothetical protein
MGVCTQANPTASTCINKVSRSGVVFSTAVQQYSTGREEGKRALETLCSFHEQPVRSKTEAAFGIGLPGRSRYARVHASVDLC